MCLFCVTEETFILPVLPKDKHNSAAIFSTNNGSSGSLSLAVASLIPGNVLTSSGYVEYQYVHSH